MNEPIARSSRPAAALLVFAATACGGDERVSLDALPAPVVAAVAARFPGSRPVEASREREAGRILYEVALERQGRRVEVTVEPQGRIRQIETEVEEAALPAAARAALERKYPGAARSGVDEIVELSGKEEKPPYYEVRLVTREKKGLEVEVTADGRIRSVEASEPGETD